MHLLFKHATCSRAACIAGALLCFASAIVLTPVRVRSQLGAAVPETRTAAPAFQAVIVPIPPTRDAFAPRAPADDDRPVPVEVRAGPASAAPVRQLDMRRPPAAVRVSALATGDHPVAIVEIGGATRTLTIGDVLQGSAIASIERDALVLANGKRFGLASFEESP